MVTEPMAGCDMSNSRIVFLSFEDAVASVTALLNNAIRPEVFWLHDGEYEARLTVDPDVALAALRARACET